VVLILFWISYICTRVSRSGESGRLVVAIGSRMPLQIRKRDVDISINFKKNIALLSYQKKGLTKVVEGGR